MSKLQLIFMFADLFLDGSLKVAFNYNLSKVFICLVPSVLGTFSRFCCCPCEFIYDGAYVYKAISVHGALELNFSKEFTI